MRAYLFHNRVLSQIAEHPPSAPSQIRHTVLSWCQESKVLRWGTAGFRGGSDVRLEESLSDRMTQSVGVDGCSYQRRVIIAVIALEGRLKKKETKGPASQGLLGAPICVNAPPVDLR